MNKELLQFLLEDDGIQIEGFLDHNKASERYVQVCFIQQDGFSWHTYVPYVDRRSNLFIKTEAELGAYLKSIKPYFSKDAMKIWAKRERDKWMKSKAKVTKQFFFPLLSFKPEIDFPDNPNYARRIQDIKDAGYSIATIKNFKGGRAARILLPIPKFTENGYETFSSQFKARVIRLLGRINAYESKQTNSNSLIPDHKFSEIRWDENTRQENTLDMSDEEIISKFQLLDNQRNQQKREVCRKCFQDGKRGVIYGIPFFYQGNEEWDKTIPVIGNEAEKGCVGCPWYDIEEWRRQLIKKLNEK